MNRIAAFAALVIATALSSADTIRPMSLQAAQQAHGKALGKLAMTPRTATIFARPDSTAAVYYRTQPYDYIVANPYSGDWVKVLLQNSESGFIRASDVQLLPYVVRGAESPTAKDLKVGQPLAAFATTYLGRRVDRRLRGGGMVADLFKKAGVTLPRSAAKQVDLGKAVTRLEDLKPGDRLYFWDDRLDRVGTAGVFIGNGYFIAPLPGTETLRVRYLGKKPLLDALVAARR